jgi:hypothetical protein
LQTNGTDDNYDFIITSSILSESGQVSAYTNNGSLMFGNLTVKPTDADIIDVKASGNNNKNVIAYPVSAFVTSPMTINFQKGYKEYGDCYVVNVNDKTEGTVRHVLGQTPVSGSYSFQDQAGSYQSTVMFTAVSK